MPHLPLYLANQGLPERMPGAGANAAAWAGPGKALALGGDRMVELAERMWKADEEHKKKKQALDAMGAVSQGIQTMEEGFLQEQQNPDFDTLDERVKKRAEDVRRETTRGITDPDVKSVVEGQLISHFTTKITRAMEIKTDRQKDASRAQILSTVGQYSDLLAGAAQEEMPKYMGQISGALALGRNLNAFTEQELEKLHAETLGTAFSVRAGRMIRENPWQALTELKGGAFELTAKQREDLIGKAETAVEHRETHILAVYDRLERQEKEAVKLRQDDLAGILREKIYAGEDAELLVNEQRRGLGDTHHRELLSLNRTLREARGAVERKSDDLSVIRLQRDISLGLRPVREISRDIDAQVRTQTLNRTDAVSLLTALGAEQRRQESEADKTREWEIGRGLDALKGTLRTTGLLNFDMASERLTSLAELEYAQKVRSSRTADPLAIADEVGMKYQQGLGDRATTEPEIFGRVLGKYQTKEQVLADYQAGKLSLPEADAKLRLLGAKSAAQQTHQVQPPAPSNRQPKKPGGH